MTMTLPKRGRPKTRLKGIKQQFNISAASEESLQILASQLEKGSANQVKREILEACTGLDANKYYIALGELQKLSNR